MASSSSAATAGAGRPARSCAFACRSVRLALEGHGCKPCPRDLHALDQPQPDTPLDCPQQISRSNCSHNRNPIASGEDNLVEMFDLKAVVECVPKTMSEMKQRQRAHNEQ